MKVIKTASSKVVKKADGKRSITLTKSDWEKIGTEAGWKEVEAKKKEIPGEKKESAKEGKPVNPWAVCTDQVGREDKEKYERCVQDVKAKHPIKKD